MGGSMVVTTSSPDDSLTTAGWKDYTDQSMNERMGGWIGVITNRWIVLCIYAWYLHQYDLESDTDEMYMDELNVLDINIYRLFNNTSR